MKLTEINLNAAMSSGNIVSKLVNCGFNTNCLRPWIGNDGRTYIAAMENGKLVSKPVTNAVATLRKMDWIKLDEAIIPAAKGRLRLVADLRGAGLEYGIDGLGYTVLQSERMTDIGDATISMDGMRAGDNDRPEFDLLNLPLPIIHKDFSYSARQIAASRNGYTPLDTSTAELAARKVAEEAEKLAIGVASKYTFAGGTIYGMINFENRLLYDITKPTASGWTPETLIDDVLGMRQESMDAYHYGPWMLYMGNSWSKYLDVDFKAFSSITLRQRLAAIDGINDVRTLDYLTGDNGLDVVLLQMSSDVVREVVGMDITTVQWESNGGMLQNFKVMAILVPQFRADINGNTGIVHGS
jgi:uncharacterized linocin/CFP29 family protein